MKIRFWCNNGANIHSQRVVMFEPEQLGLSEDEWMALTEEEKYEVVEEWALGCLEYGYVEVE